MGRRCVCPRVFAPPRPLASALIRGKCESRYECNRRGVAGPNGLVQTVIIITIRISQLGSKRDRDYRELSVGRRLWKILNHPSRIRHVAARCRNMLDGRACGGLGAQLMRSLKRAGASMGSRHLITFGIAIASVAGSGACRVHHRQRRGRGCVRGYGSPCGVGVHDRCVSWHGLGRRQSFGSQWTSLFHARSRSRPS